MELTKKDVEKWLNDQIKGYNLMTKQVSFISNISIYDQQIHVRSEGMLEIKALGFNVVKLKREDKDYPWMLQFIYKGFKFFALYEDAQKDLLD